MTGEHRDCPVSCRKWLGPVLFKKELQKHFHFSGLFGLEAAGKGLYMDAPTRQTALPSLQRWGLSQGCGTQGTPPGPLRGMACLWVLPLQGTFLQ